MSYVWNLLIGIDQLANTVIGGAPDETVSARAWRRQHASLRWRVTRRSIDCLFKLLFDEVGHCENSYLNEILRRHMPREYSKHEAA